MHKKVSELKFGFEDLNLNSFGPLVTKEHLESVEKNIKMAEEEGAKLSLTEETLLNEKILTMVIS